MLSGLVDDILTVPSWVALLLVFLLPGLEASIFLGVVLPGEVAVILGGVIASRGELPLWTVIVVAIAGSVIGDQIGWLVGYKWGDAVLAKVPRRFLSEANIERSKSFVNRLGAWAVILGRWTALLRALTPGIAGMSKMHYRKFALANLVGGGLWATACVVGGYLVGDAYKKLEKYINDASYAAVAVVVVVVVFLVYRHLRGHPGNDPDPMMDAVDDYMDEDADPVTSTS